MKQSCKECWDPVDKDGAELCDWCHMTPEQREARQRRSWWLLAVAVWLLIGGLWISQGGAPWV